MFKKLQFNRKVNKIVRSWDMPIHELELIDKVALTIIMHIIDSQKHVSILKNKYVCTDAAILSSIYFCKIAENERDYNTLVKGLLKRIFMSCNKLFLISLDDIDRMFHNRLEMFENLIFSDSSLESIHNEVSFLFSCDIAYNKYMEFTAKTALPIMDFEKQFIIHAETKMFLASLNRLIDKLFLA